MNDKPSFLDGGGETGALVAAHDWLATSLGPIEAWPQSLKTATSLLLRSPVPIVMLWGEDGIMLYNDAYSGFAGGRHPELLGSRVREGWPEVADFNDNVMKVGLAGKTLAYKNQELTLYRHGGPEQVWMNLDYSPVFDESSKPAGVICILNETTEAVKSEAALRESGERLRLVIEGARDHAIFTTDPAGTITSWSAGAAAIFGWSSAEAVGRPSSIIFTPQDRTAEVDVRELATAAREGCANDERWHLRKDGARVFMNGSVHPLPADAQGLERGFIKIARDETARRRSEDASRETQERYRLVVRATNDAIWDWHFATNHVLWNEALGAAYGHAPANVEPTGEWWLEHIHPDDRGRVSHSIHDAIDGTAERWQDEYRFRRADGSYADVLDRGFVFRDAQGRGVRMIGAMLDLTERRRAEQELRELNETLEQRVEERTHELMSVEEALRQSQKMEAVGQLTGGLAHDFNNLLAGISGSLDMMQTRIRQGRVAEIDRYMVGAQGAARRAAALTHRLLAFSRRQTLEPKPTDVNRLIVGMEDLIQRTVGPQITVESVAKAGLWSTLVDPNQLENALLNLSINARDAMPDGGKITIETGNRWLDDRAAQERDLSPGQYVSMCVSDTGTGMTPDVIKRAFDPFFTTKPIGVGTGLGLSMIYGFARQSGGQVRIYSEVGQGTMICIYLPRHVAEEVVEPETEPSPVQDRVHGKTVLVVDDEALVRMLVVDAVEDLGFVAMEAGDGPQALKILRSATHLDLLITDVGLPNGMNGRQVADAARELRPDLKVLFVTGYAENAVLSHGHLDPGMQVVTKPFDMTVLARRIRDLITD